MIPSYDTGPAAAAVLLLVLGAIIGVRLAIDAQENLKATEIDPRSVVELGVVVAMTIPFVV